MASSYNLLPHTADLRAEVTADRLIDLYRAGVDLVRTIVFGDSPVDPGSQLQVDLPQAPESDRFFHFVREVVFLVDSRSWVPGGVALREDRAELVGEGFDPMRHHIERQIKAVTRHDYQFEGKPGFFRAELIFDL